MPFGAPYRLGPFLVGRDGGVMPPADRAANFSVRWHGCTMQAELRAAEVDAVGVGGAVALSMRAEIGRVPSTASAGAGPREAVLEMLRVMDGLAPAGFALGLSADHRLMFMAERRLDLPVTARVLVSELSGFLLQAAPYLDLATESGAPVPTGTAKT
jgi:hypothetical protein